jgi:hypothetical protein
MGVGCSRDADTTLSFWSFHAGRSLDDKRLDSLFIHIFFTFCAGSLPVYQNDAHDKLLQKQWPGGAPRGKRVDRPPSG